MATSSQTLVSVEEYLARAEKPNAEYEDGIVYPKPMPSLPHSEIQFRVAELLRRQGARAFPELTVRLRPGMFRVPDVTVVEKVEGDYPTTPAVLCIEILSPEQGIGEMFAKCEKYHAWGVPHCWVIDPEKRTAWEYNRGGEPSKLPAGGVLRAGEFSIPLDELFAGLTA